MSVVDNIATIIKEKGMTFKRLEQECSLGNGTIKRWEVQSPRLDRLMLVAEYLNVSLDALVYGRQTETTCDGIPLDEDESDIVAMYRYIDKRDQEDVFDYVKLKYDKATGERPSIYSTYTDTKKRQKSDPADDGKTSSGIA